MEVIVFSKCKHVEKPYWLFCKELALALKMTVHQVHQFEEVDYYWVNFASNLYKRKVKEIKDQIKTGVTVRYKMLTILKELCTNNDNKVNYIPNRVDDMLKLSLGSDKIIYEFSI